MIGDNTISTKDEKDTPKEVCCNHISAKYARNYIGSDDHIFYRIKQEMCKGNMMLDYYITSSTYSLGSDEIEQRLMQIQEMLSKLGYSCWIKTSGHYDEPYLYIRWDDHELE